MTDAKTSLKLSITERNTTTTSAKYTASAGLHTRFINHHIQMVLNWSRLEHTNHTHLASSTNSEEPIMVQC